MDVIKDLEIKRLSPDYLCGPSVITKVLARGGGCRVTDTEGDVTREAGQRTGRCWLSR